MLGVAAGVVSERPGRGWPSPAGRPAREAEPLGAGASEAGAPVGGELGAEGEGAAVPVGAGAGGTGVPGLTVRPGEAVPEAGVEGSVVPSGVAEEGVATVAVGPDGTEGPDGVVGAGGVDGATVRVPPGASAPYARGAAHRAAAQTNVQASAGPRARARALRSAGVTG
ncbi:hypothetical protein ASC82_26970 [Streptomyces sp. Root431]|nr:hypothetical protein ASC82_26970 [Streptomyces sp. Root431]